MPEQLRLTASIERENVDSNEAVIFEIWVTFISSIVLNAADIPQSAMWKPERSHENQPLAMCPDNIFFLYFLRHHLEHA